MKLRALPRRGLARITAWRDAAQSVGLLRLFGAISFVGIMLVSMVVAYGTSRLFADRVVNRDALVTSQFVQTLVETSLLSQPEPADEQDRYPPYQAFFGGYGDPTLETQFETFFERLGHMPDVVRASAYAADGLRIWSTSPKQVGILNVTTNDELRGATFGKLSTKFTEQIWFPTVSERARMRPGVHQFLETYMPIWNPERDTVVGIVETYKMADELHGTVRQSQLLVFAGVVLGGLLLYGLLYGVVGRAETQVHQQRKQLVEAEHFVAIGQMASAVAHSIRNPLASIRSTAEVVIELGECPSSREDLDAIITDVDRTEGALQGLLQYAQPGVHEPVRTDIKRLLEHILNELRPRASRQDVALHFEADASLPEIFASPALLAQAVQSITANALDAMPTGGQLTVSATSPARAKAIEISFRDSGIGMKPEEANKVFVPFYTTKGHGMGVGLPLARRIVSLHGGAIHIAGIPGSGTTVTMDLPTERTA